MAEQQQPSVLSAAFPAPPPFYKHFTSENIDRLKDLQQHQAEAELNELPEDLRYLVPPLPPTDGTYSSFGDSYNVVDSLPTLEAQGIEQLYPSPPDRSSTAADGTKSEWTLDRAFYLQKMAKSLLLNFMELVGVLSVDPSQYARKIEDLRTLFVNAHHLLNEYRPHQARETLILMLEEQLRRCQAETKSMRLMKGKVEEVLQEVVRDNEEAVRLNGLDDGLELRQDRSRRELEEQRVVWDMLRSELSA